MKHYQNLYGNKFQPRPMLVEMAKKIKNLNYLHKENKRYVYLLVIAMQ